MYFLFSGTTSHKGQSSTLNTPGQMQSKPQKYPYVEQTRSRTTDLSKSNKCPPNWRPELKTAESKEHHSYDDDENKDSGFDEGFEEESTSSSDEDVLSRSGDLKSTTNIGEQSVSTTSCTDPSTSLSKRQLKRQRKRERKREEESLPNQKLVTVKGKL